MTLTWEEVRARSEEKQGTITTYCGDCGMLFPHSGLPCRKHATPEESKAIDELIATTLAGAPMLRRPR